MSKRGQEVRVVPDDDALAHAAAELFTTCFRNAVASHNRFTVAVSGGSTPRRLYALLGLPPYCEGLDWNALHLFWVDERCVPPGHTESNYTLVRDTLLSRVPVPERNVHRIRGEEGPERAASLYEKELKTFFAASEVPVFDLILLGVGEDGHIASIFPGSPATRETTQLVMPVYRDPPELNRVTMTLRVLNNAGQIAFLVAGDRKQNVLHDILSGKHTRTSPAGLVQAMHGKLSWLLDERAAKKLRL